MNADDSLPSIACFYGASGVGKTTSAIWAMSAHQAKYIAVGGSWTKRTLIENLAKEFHISSIRSVPDGVARIIFELKQKIRPIIIDEADYLIDGAKVPKIELIREISDATNCPIILLGEGQLPSNIRSLERVHNRVLKWQVAERASNEDIKLLVEKFAPELTFSKDLIEKLNSHNKGIIRYVMADIYAACDVCTGLDLKEIDLAIFKAKGGFNNSYAPNGGKA